jgi:hypothetical protein
VFVEQIRGADEHLMVQAHEALHHELQTSTVWGAVWHRWLRCSRSRASANTH